MDKQRIHLAEFNVLMKSATYLPLVSGILQAHAETSELIRAHFEFAPFLFHTDSLDKILATYETPALAAFSMSMWNTQLSLAVAEEVKRRHPKCLILVGGPSVPHDPRDFFAEHAFIDLAVRGEGEDAFKDILVRIAEQDSPAVVDFDGLAGVSWRTEAGEFREAVGERPLVRDLDQYPSPYLNGMFEELIAQHPDIDFQAIIETNRGCPFKCTFCYWGKGGLSRKYRFHSLERVKGEIDWLAANRIQYVFNADSNFGMHNRDMEIAQMLVESKRTHGYPEKFRTCYGKNTDEKIFAVGNLLQEHGLEKGITISYQSVDAGVQSNIKRTNIKLDRAWDLQRRFNESGVPVYTELILGLPGESLHSWIQGVDTVLGSGLKNQLFMYICQVYPNTELADPGYQERFGIETRKIDLQEIHGNLRSEDRITEVEEIIVSTDAMSQEDWRQALIFSWVTMSMVSLKLGFYLLAWMKDRFDIPHSEFLKRLAKGPFDSSHPILTRELTTLHHKIDCILEGRGRGCILPEYGEIYWDEEEASFLRISRDFDAFYTELENLTQRFLTERGLDFDAQELAEVIRYQSLAIPRPKGRTETTQSFDRNLHEYFEALFTTAPIAIEPKPQILHALQTNFDGDLPRFAQESILWGRKSGTLLAKISPAEVLEPHPPTLDPVATETPSGPRQEPLQRHP